MSGPSHPTPRGWRSRLEISESRWRREGKAQGASGVVESKWKGSSETYEVRGLDDERGPRTPSSVLVRSTVSQKTSPPQMTSGHESTGSVVERIRRDSGSLPRGPNKGKRSFFGPRLRRRCRPPDPRGGPWTLNTRFRVRPRPVRQLPGLPGTRLPSCTRTLSRGPGRGREGSLSSSPDLGPPGVVVGVVGCVNPWSATRCRRREGTGEDPKRR